MPENALLNFWRRACVRSLSLAEKNKKNIVIGSDPPTRSSFFLTAMGNSKSRQYPSSCEDAEPQLPVDFPADASDTPTTSRRPSFSSTVSHPPSSPHLHDHVLQMVFKLNFGNLSDLHNIQATCKDWRRIVERMTCLGASLITSQGEIDDMQQNGPTLLGRHIGSLRWPYCPIRVFQDQISALPSWAPNLKSLYAYVHNKGIETTLTTRSGHDILETLRFPSTLRKLHLTVSKDTNILIKLIGKAIQLKEVGITTSLLSSQLDVRPLAQLIHLKTVRFIIEQSSMDEEERQLSDAQASVLLQLPELRYARFGTNNVDYKIWTRLLSLDQHTLELEHIDPLGGCDDKLATLIVKRLPALRSLRISHTCTFTSWEFLSRLSCLTRIDISFRRADKQVGPELLRTVQRGHCREITHLSMLMAPYTSDEMETLFNGMPQLKLLHLIDPTHLQSLKFLESSSSLHESLRHLHLNCLLDMRMDEIESIVCLQALQTLAISYSFDTRISQKILNPLCASLPHLSSFKYMPPDGRLTAGDGNWMIDDVVV